MMTVAPNEYLDARRPEWRPSEVVGLVRYDAPAQIVTVYDYVIARALRPAS